MSLSNVCVCTFVTSSVRHVLFKHTVRGDLQTQGMLWQLYQSKCLAKPYKRSQTSIGCQSTHTYMHTYTHTHSWHKMYWRQTWWDRLKNTSFNILKHFQNSWLHSCFFKRTLIQNSCGPKEKGTLKIITSLITVYKLSPSRYLQIFEIPLLFAH